MGNAVSNYAEGIRFYAIVARAFARVLYARGDRGDYDILGDAVARVFELSIKDTILNMIESIGMADDLAEEARIAEEAGYHGLVRIK